MLACLRCTNQIIESLSNSLRFFSSFNRCLLGLDELSACQSAQAGRAESRVAAAVAASPLGGDATFYARAVAPQLASLLIFNTRKNVVDFPELVAQSRVGLDALAQLHERGFSKIVVASLLGQFGGVTDETGVARGLCILRSLSQHALPGFWGKLSLDSKLLEYLICLVNFAQNSNGKVCAQDVALILRYVLQSSINPEALIFDAMTRPRTIRFESRLQGGIVAVESDEIQDIDVTILIEALDSPKLPSSLLALCLYKFLEWRRQRQASDLSRIRPTLKLAADLSTHLDTGTMFAPGADLIRTVGLLLSDAADRIHASSLNLKPNVNEEEDNCSLETVALSTLLSILESGVLERSIEHETALRALLPSLTLLSCPRYHDAEISKAAVQCRAIIFSRGCQVMHSQVKSDSASHASEAMLAEIALDISSPLPALRAFCVVRLGKLCKHYTLNRDRGHVQEMSSRLSKPIPWLKLADILLKALEDQESYVYLAAAHALAAVADTSPREVLPWFLQSFCSLSNDVIKTRLGETLMITIRRRGEAAPAYAQIVGESLCCGARHDQPVATRIANLSLLGELCGVVGINVHTFAIDLCNLVSSILVSTDVTADVRRAASYLGYRAIAGCGTALITNVPRDCATMCKRLRVHALNSADDVTRLHANNALLALDALLSGVLRVKQNGSLEKGELPPIYRDDWFHGGFPRLPT